MKLVEFKYFVRKELRQLGDPDLECFYLIKELTGWERALQFLNQDYLLNQEQLIELKSMLNRRKQGEPLAYILGHWGFRELDLRVTTDTLIPRPETELLVDQVLQQLKGNQTGLDLGTGTGAIALSLAYESENFQMLAVDCSEKALAVAQQNADNHDIDRVEFIQSDWFESIEKRNFDFIVSNPPYVAEGDTHLQDLSHEPISALTSGADGLKDIRHIISQAPNFLIDGGRLFLEHGYDQGEAVGSIFREHQWDQIVTVKDLAGKDRISYAQWIG
ncbi:MAG: peptide chain release factor N(5)-glutamine methyltransferase [bacterium]